MTKAHFLQVLSMGIDTHQEPVVYMHEGCHICRSEGFNANTRLLIRAGTVELIATLNVVHGDSLLPGQIGLSMIAQERLRTKDGESVNVSHAPIVESLSQVRKKIYGHALNDGEISAIVTDISNHRYSDIEIASFISICAGRRLSLDEIIGLTRAMIACGKRLSWPGNKEIFDKHCIGGLPGNRTTPLVVSIVSAAGLMIPKTSSRAITSPAGTADTMEAITQVNLDITDIQRVVAETNACLAWGGAVNLSPADDLLIRIERALDLDGEGQLIASVLSKKIAAGSTHAVIDIPVGETVKIRSRKEADRLVSLFTQVGAACGIHIRCVITDGSQPVGQGIGPVEEARDILSVLRCEDLAPQDLRERALFLAAHLLELSGDQNFDESYEQAVEILDSGGAWSQFQRIVEAQGGLKALPEAKFQHGETAPVTGTVTAVDNRQLSRLAKLAGAPLTPSAGIRLHIRVGDVVTPDTLLFTLFSDSTGELDYALDFYRHHASVFTIEAML